MARRNSDDFADTPGQDSFLDVLTNMVGIIILLVVVMGIRTSQATIQQAVEQVAVVDDRPERVAKSELDRATREAIQAQAELQGLLRQAVELRSETALRERERSYLTTFTAAVDEELKARRAALSAEQQSDFDLRRQLAESQARLEELTREQVTLLSAPAESEVEAIENQPTPLARLATGRRVALYLSAGYVAVIPEEEAAKEIVRDARENVWRLRDSNYYIGTVGPIGGFKFRYLLASIPVQATPPSALRDRGLPNNYPAARVISLLRYQLLPETAQSGEPVADAIKPNSALRAALRENPADVAHVAIAAYADSIRELHVLKRELREQNYAIAEVPLPVGQALTVSISHHSRSAETFTQ